MGLVCVVCDDYVALTGGTAAAQASDSWADSSPPPSAPAAATTSPANAAAPPRSPGTARTSRDDTLGSGDTDMASSAVVAAAGERLSPFFRGNNSRKVKDYSTSNVAWKRIFRTRLLLHLVPLQAPVHQKTDPSVKECHSLFIGHVRLLEEQDM